MRGFYFSRGAAQTVVGGAGFSLFWRRMGGGRRFGRLGALALAACGGGDDAGALGTATACVPDAVAACACPGTAGTGTQRCAADGSRYGACQGCPPPDLAPGLARFVDVTEEAGVLYLQQPFPAKVTDCAYPTFCDPDTQSGGAAVGDYDGDGRLDLYVTRMDDTAILFRNRGDGTFEDVTVAAGLVVTHHTNGAAWADIDNDGDLDLYVTTIVGTRHLLYVNDGAGHFTEEALPRGAAIETVNAHWGTSVAVGDYDRDGWLDLHVSEWGPKDLWKDPTLLGHTRLLRNRGQAAPGHFEDVTVAAGVVIDVPKPSGMGYENAFALAGAIVDLDDDGWPDLAVAVDFGGSRLFWNDGDGTFTDGTKAAGVGHDRNGMGSTIGDVDGDGALDWFVSSIAPVEGCSPCATDDIGNHLYLGRGGRTFEDAAESYGVVEGFWGWGTAFFDYDNDADLDLVLATGMNGFWLPLAEPYEMDPMRLWRNDGAPPMAEVSAEVGLVDAREGKGVVTFDYDDDGDLDLFVVNTFATPVLWRNDFQGSFLRVRVLHPSGRDAIGAKVRLRASPDGPSELRHIGVGTHYQGQSENVAHFGLGDGTAPVSEVRVWFPDTGEEKTLTDVTRNQTLVVGP
jgi:hypothetical protein